MAALSFDILIVTLVLLNPVYCQHSDDVDCVVKQLFRTVSELSLRVKECCQSQIQNSNEIFYVFASPFYIANHSSFLQTTFVANPSSIRFPPAALRRTKLFKLPLIESNELLDSVTYIVTIKFWKIMETNDNDVEVALCDSARCMGFHYYDIGGIHLVEWNDTDNECFQPSRHAETDWGLRGKEQVWDAKFEISPDQNTWASTVSPVFSRAFATTFSSTLKISSGLWLTACRGQAHEQHDFRYFEVAVKRN